MITRVFTVASLVLLSACVTPTYNAPIKDIRADSLQDYWRYDQDHLSKAVSLIGTTEGCYRIFPESVKNEGLSESAASVTATFVIDSKGNSFEHNLVSGTSNNTVNSMMMSAFVENVKFAVSESNINGVPVRITTSFGLFAQPRICRPFEDVEKLLATPGSSIWAEQRFY